MGTCEGCRFYHPDVTTSTTNYNNGAGECRIHPPRTFPFEPVYGGLDAAYRMWPIVRSDDWCGHFAPEGAA